LHETITLQPRAFSPGLITNPLDRFYFLPLATVRTYTLEQLMAFMIHESDNTATDAILHRLGGTCAVMKFVFASDIEGISVKRTMHELLTYYYNLEPSHGIGGMLANARRMTPAF